MRNPSFDALQGSYESYVRAILAPACRAVSQGGLGYRAVVVNFRGCAWYRNPLQRNPLMKLTTCRCWCAHHESPTLLCGTYGRYPSGCVSYIQPIPGCSPTGTLLFPRSKCNDSLHRRGRGALPLPVCMCPRMCRLYFLVFGSEINPLRHAAVGFTSECP